MKEGHIYVYGDIFNEQSDYAKEYGIVSLSHVVQQIQQNQDADKLIVHIHSRGGDVYEGFAIHDVLVNSKKEITTIIEGLCASIATVISLAGTERQMLENSEFMIHNPVGGVHGDAEDIAKYAERIKAEQERIIDFYVEKTGGAKDKIEALVNEETWMEASVAKDLGFVTEVVETIEALAIFGNINHKNKSKMEVENELKGLKKVLQDLVNFVKNQQTPENLSLSSVDGVKLVFDTDQPIVTVGDRVSCEDKSFDMKDSSFLMPEGETIVVKDGVVESIIPKEEDVDTVNKVENTAEVEALTSEVTNLKQEIADLKATAKTTEEGYQETIKGIQENVEFLKKNVGSNHTPPENRDNFKNKPPVEETPIQAALRLKREAKNN